MAQFPDFNERPHVEVHVPDDAWQEIEWDETSPPAHHLLARLVLNGTLMHLEAFLVVPDTDDQRTYVNDESVAIIHREMGADAPWDTTTIKGQPYVVVATPYC